MSTSQPDEHWMKLALREARKGIGLTSPNPAVGAVLVRGGEVLGKGWHRKAGGPHAEVEALRDAARRGHEVRGADIFITLEPCCTHGRTPPCTGALISAGIRRVVWAVDDANPHHTGAARRVLSEAGIETASGVQEQPCRELNRGFFHWITTGRPWVIAKAGMTLDGRITRPAGESRWITSEPARADAMQLRLRSDAILIGAGTLRADDPHLTLRGPGIPRGKEQPWRVVLTEHGDLPQQARLFTDEWKHRTLVLQGQPLRTALEDLGRRGVTCVLIEGGSSILAQAFDADLVDEAVFYVAPLISGSGLPVVNADLFRGSSRAMQFTGVRMLGQDVRLEAVRAV